MLLAGTTIFAIGFGLFVAFVAWNGGVAVGDKDKHPFPSFHLGNVYFCLFVAFFVFLPLHVANARLVFDRLRTSRVLVPALAAFFVIYMLTFSNEHPYNQGLDSMFIRNRILSYFTQTPTLMALFFPPVAYSFMSFAVTPLVRPFGTLLAPITVLYLIPSWLIEQRYYFIPFTLFLLLREQKSARLENISAAYSIVCTILLLVPVSMRWLFI